MTMTIDQLYTAALADLENEANAAIQDARQEADERLAEGEEEAEQYRELVRGLKAFRTQGPNTERFEAIILECTEIEREMLRILPQREFIALNNKFDRLKNEAQGILGQAGASPEIFWLLTSVACAEVYDEEGVDFYADDEAGA